MSETTQKMNRVLGFFVHVTPPKAGEKHPERTLFALLEGGGWQQVMTVHDKRHFAVVEGGHLLMLSRNTSKWTADFLPAPQFLPPSKGVAPLMEGAGVLRDRTQLLLSDAARLLKKKVCRVVVTNIDGLAVWDAETAELVDTVPNRPSAADAAAVAAALLKKHKKPVTPPALWTSSSSDAVPEKPAPRKRSNSPFTWCGVDLQAARKRLAQCTDT